MFEVVNDLPKWLIEYLENNTGFKRAGFAGYPYPIITSESEAVIEFYKFISQPKHTAKLPEVAKLVEACKLEYREIPDTIMGKGFKVGNLNAEKIKEALKPFKEKE